MPKLTFPRSLAVIASLVLSAGAAVGLFRDPVPAARPHESNALPFGALKRHP